MAQKKQTKDYKAFKFYDSAPGHLVLTIIIWFIGFNLLLLAIDTGSLLQWGVVLVSLLWGAHHLIQSIKLAYKRVWKPKKKN